MPTVTRAFVEKQLENLNRLAGMPPKPYEMVGGKMVPQAGCFHLDNAHRGYCVVRMSMSPGSTGEGKPFSSGYFSLKTTSELLHAYTQGYRDGKESLQ